MNRLKLLIFILYVIDIIKGHKIDLNGNWTGLIESINFSFAAHVPGGIYTDLANINYISSNLIDQNDVKNRWIGNETITYTKSFHGTFNSTSKAILIFHGLDTFASIHLNDYFIGNTSNMFVKYVFDVEKYIKEGENILKVSFESPTKVSQNLFEKQSENYVIPPICVPAQYKGECHVNHIRKMQASFAWDWGPAFPSMGIWKNVELIATETLIHDITTDTYKIHDNWHTNVTIYMQLFDRMEDSLEFNITIELVCDEILRNSTRVVQSKISNYTNASITLITPQNLVKEWWPNGYGDQNLYTLKINVTFSNTIIQRSLRIGFRTVQLVQEPLAKGLSFYFKINGIPIFAKGSNYIPSSVFPELMNNETHLKDLFDSVKRAHMNMLRVWGGGVYEFDLFYDLADEYGITIWQDFMFACSMYPTTEVFLKSVEEELLQNVRRLKNHPSIVIWAGNNENEAALYDNWYGTGSEKIYQQDYHKLYVNLIKPLIEREDLTRPFVVSSPSNGLHAQNYNYTGENPYSNLYGDTHYYNYFRNGWDINQYPRTRFSSEYGFQSLPSIYTLQLSTNNVSNLKIDSEYLNHRQHLPTGNSFMTFLISKNLKIRSNDSYQDFRDYIYLSQINQAVSVKIQSEFYRQCKSHVNEIGEGLTMGALYWQLNDVWQAPTWSSIDFYGNWKMLHYYATEFFAPVIVATNLSVDRKLEIFVVSDILRPIENCTIEMRIHKWTDLIPIRRIEYDNIYIEANKAKLVTSLWLDDALQEYGCGSSTNTRYNCIICLTLKHHNGTQIAPTNYVYPTSLKDVNLPIADIHMEFDEMDFQTFQIKLSTNNIALFVWLEMKNIKGRFSRNGFHMFENNVTITFHSYVPITLEILRESIEMTNLSDLYNENKQRRQIGGK